MRAKYNPLKTLKSAVDKLRELSAHTRGASLPVDRENVYDMKPNPSLRDYRHSPGMRATGKAFNRAYLGLLDKMQLAFTGAPDTVGRGALTAGPIFGYQKGAD